MLLAPLKRELQRKLNDARADRGRIDHAKLAVGRVCAGISELRVVECVEKFGAELQRLRLADGDLLRERHIPVVLPRAEHDPESGVAETGPTSAAGGSDDRGAAEDAAIEIARIARRTAGYRKKAFRDAVGQTTRSRDIGGRHARAKLSRIQGGTGSEAEDRSARAVGNGQGLAILEGSYARPGPTRTQFAQK